MGDRSDLRVWFMTTGETGSRQQARGLARAISATAEERIIRVNRLAALAPPALFSRGLSGVVSVEGSIAPPWPDVLVSCGRRSSLASMAIRRRAGTPMVAIHIQPPVTPAAFDLVVALPHDQISGPNVITVDTALHGISLADLDAAAVQRDSRFAHMPRPWTGVLLGGATRRRLFSQEDSHRLVAQLDDLRGMEGGALMITPSRRTPRDVVAAIKARYQGDPAVFLWDDDLANPYLAILAQSDRLVVTSDSVSMISEALATRADVRIFEFPGGERHMRFVRSLVQKGLVTTLSAPPRTPRPPRAPIEATSAVLGVVRGILAERLAGE